MTLGSSSSMRKYMHLLALGRLEVLIGAKALTTHSRLLYTVEMVLGGGAIPSHMVRIALSPVLNTAFIQCYEILILFLDGTDIAQQNMHGGNAWSEKISASDNSGDYYMHQSGWNEAY